MSDVKLNSLNTDLSHYTLDDVLNLLNIVGLDTSLQGLLIA